MTSQLQKMKKENAEGALSVGLLKNRSGIALLLVLWVLTLLTVISGEFCRAMRTEANISRNFRDATQAYYAAVGGVNLAIFQILKRAAPSSTPDAVAEDETQDQAQLRINWQNPQMKVGQGSIRVWIDNEGGKVNINLAEEGLLRKLIGGFDLDDEEKSIIINSILDWRDADDLHRLNGAESDYYQSLSQPYACKNGDFDTIDELMRVRGITPEMFHGGLSRMTTVSPGRKALQKREGWVDGQKRPEGLFDYNRININAASPELLGILFGFGSDLVDGIVAFRRERDLKTNLELLEIIGAKQLADAGNYLTYDRSPFYRVRAGGTLAGSEARQAVGALVHVDMEADKKYRIVQWVDHIRADEMGWMDVSDSEFDG